MSTVAPTQRPPTCVTCDSSGDETGHCAATLAAAADLRWSPWQHRSTLPPTTPPCSAPRRGQCHRHRRRHRLALRRPDRPSNGRPNAAAALFDRSNRSILTVTGADRLTWLHTLTSQHLSELADGQVTEALVLSPQGHVEHHFVVTELGGTTYLDTEPGAGPALLGYLDGMRFWSKVEVSDASAEFALLDAGRPAGAGRPRAHGVCRVTDRAPAARRRCPTAGWCGRPRRASTCWSPAGSSPRSRRR